uniref:Uncharacterized protein n=1 Tax=Ananas comosus var. bracteatus TaxID=296719 RepID=A0A6V7PSK3_ANACO|nr:unnamed protein product [Ananas comosus var. bracteatus]
MRAPGGSGSRAWRSGAEKVGCSSSNGAGGGRGIMWDAGPWRRRQRSAARQSGEDRVSSCEDWIILTSLFSLVGGRSTEAVVYVVLHDRVVPQTVSVCECSSSSPMRLRVSRQPSGWP